MILPQPQNVKFETQMDVIDYLTKYVPPTKGEYDQLMDAIHMGRTKKYDGLVAVPETCCHGLNQDEFEQVLRRVYENQKKSNLLAFGAGVVVTLLVAPFFMSGKSKDEDY